jgi:isoleucyl-tRNA synthetase
MFEPLPAQFSFPEAEQRVLQFWEKQDIFGKSLEIRRGSPRFVFYEGPPTANGLPHPGHCLTRAIKDLFPRYQTMCGKLVERKAGWDTHGLPVEVEVCKELGIHTKEEIEAYGVEKFVRKCIESVFRYTREWEQMTRRLGFWVNLEEAYVTFHQSYVESVWWGLKTLFERGLLYQGHKVVWWWAQGGTALSAGEVGEGYRTVRDPAVYVRFPLVAERVEGPRGRGAEGMAARTLPHLTPGPLGPSDPSRVSLLVWTTTPWTLVSNHFAAVGPDIDYALVHDTATDEYLYVAAALVGTTAAAVKHKLETVGTCKGSDLIGLRYVPPFDCYHKTMGGQTARLKDGGDDCIGWRVTAADFVTLDAGTGLVHEAPAYGEVDFNLLQEERKRFADFDAIPLINAVKPDGTFNEEAPAAYRGRWVKDCDKEIMQELKARGLLYHQETIEHEYPFCPRSEDDPLIQYARKSWFVRTSQFKDEFLKNNAAIQWLPEHIREGRFGDFLRNNVDWALSRERWWGTPLPIWVCEQTGKMEAIGSYAELLAKPGVQGTEVWERAKAADPSLPDHLKVHKPYIDAITYDSPFVEAAGNGEEGTGSKAQGAESREQGAGKPRMRRVPEVIDCWWDAGSMPFAQWGFPHAGDSVQTFVDRFPCDFISEAIDQTRGWFYGLLAISTLLFKDGVPLAGSMGLRPVPGNAGLPPVPGNAGLPPVTPPRPTLPTTKVLNKRRRLLPHWEAGGSTYILTFCLHRGQLTPDERSLVLDACRHWDGQRMLLHAAVVMPDHVHLLCTPLESGPGTWWSVADLMHSIKGYTATQLNRRRGASGPLWQQEYHDRIIRDESDFDEKWNYVVTNPVRRGLPEDYPWVWVEPTHATDGPEAHAPRLAYPHPYKTCIVLGHVMGEDGLKMSKRTKNYKEPGYIFDHYGADAMRWYFFSAQAPWTSVRFQEANIRDAQREFLVRLYHVFSFFNIYANIDGFAVEQGPRGQRTEGSRDGQSSSPAAPWTLGPSDPVGTGWRPAGERSELDRWIISELHRTIRSVRSDLDRFENYPAAGRLNEFVDALSNWYVRRSRERFWRPVAAGGSPADQDKWDAYNTLYEVLVALSKLIAPFTPFFAEVMYQNLAGSQGAREQEREGERSSIPRSHDPSIPLSVHLCDYPVADEALIDEALAQEMDLVREIVSLGRAARTAAKLKVRQPLGLVEIILARSEHTEVLRAHGALIAEELNIKRVEFATEAEQYVTYQIKPDFKAIGPKFGKLAPQVAAALGTLDPVAARRSLAETGEVAVDVAGQVVRLGEREVEIRLEARPGWSAAQGRAGVVVVKTELTEELREEGLCRELIHHIQELRKSQKLPYEARIQLHVQGPDRIRSLVERFSATIETECLAATITHAAPLPGVDAHAARIEGHEVVLAIARV